MIPKDCKRLAEVDFPIAEVSRHAVREKSIRHGHPSTLHLWWARRPLASSRAVLIALLLPDPCDPNCPEAFSPRARQALLSMKSRPSSWDRQLESPDGLRRVLLEFIANFANWDNAASAEYIETGRALVKAAHPRDTPLVVDPFAGGGSIPLEALRLGCEAFASDLNPVACLILKVMLEDIPRHGPDLAQELRRVGAEIKTKAERELADLYPTDPDGATPIAYLWARTVRCEAPSCGAEIPLMRSFWLCRKANRKIALRHSVARPDNAPPQVAFKIKIFKPDSNDEVRGGSVSRARATCLCCEAVLPPARVRSQLAAQRGGADVTFDENGIRTGGARMTAVVTLRPNERGRHYRLPTAADYAAVHRAQERVARILDEWERGGKQGLCPVPDEPAPTKDTHRAVGSQIPLYGITTFGDLFTARQKLTLIEGAREISKGGEILGLSLGKVARHCNVLSKWHKGSETVAGSFGMQTLPMSWDFPEMFPFVPYAGGFENAITDVIGASSTVSHVVKSAGQIQPADATAHPLPDQSAGVWFTDPPYYDAIPYADLSDFFLVWLKRAFPDYPLLHDPFGENNRLSPKTAEIVQCERVKDINGTSKDREFYERSMARAFAEGRRVLSEDGVGSVVFAHKTTEGWEALLSGMIRGGWTITGSWPIKTERGARLNARETAHLATSVHLICRPRPEDAPVGDWADVLRELPGRVGDWMERLQREGVRGADLVFACVGPALEIFSRYSRVETVEGDVVGLPEYLERVWEVVGRTALETVLGTAEARARNGALGALEEDARLTALFLWTMQSTAEGFPADSGADTAAAPRQMFSLPFDVARRFAQPLGIHLDSWESRRIIQIRKGVVRLIPVDDRRQWLFGESGVDTIADLLESNAGSDHQLNLFPDSPPTARRRSSRRPQRALDSDTAAAPQTSRSRNTQAVAPDDLHTVPGWTTLDHVHAAMLLQSSGRSQSLRNLLQSQQERGPDFLRLANALSALYPRSSQEKRLLDAMLLAAPRQ